MRTNLVMVVDRTGSMAGSADEASKAINLFIEEQKRVEGKAWFTMVQFDNTGTDTLYDSVRLPEVTADYQLDARGMTNLFDTLGRTIRRAEQQGLLRQIEGKKLFDKTIFVILTDGLENASVEFTAEAVKAMVEQKTTEGWDFVYLGAGDLFTQKQHVAQAGVTGMSAASTLTHDKEHYASAASATSAAVGRSRLTGSAVEYTDQERAEAGEPTDTGD